MPLLLVRHPESRRNLYIGDDVFWKDTTQRDAHGDIPDQEVDCSQKGMEQVPKIVEGILNVGLPTTIYHSGYNRVIPVVSYLSVRSPGSTIRHSCFLRERDPGYCHNMTRKEVRRNFPWLQEYWKTVGGFYARPPGGESMADVCFRADRVLDMLQSEVNWKDLTVLVGHKNFFWCLRKLLDGWPEEKIIEWPEGQEPGNGSMTLYEGETPNSLVFKSCKQLV